MKKSDNKLKVTSEQLWLVWQARLMTVARACLALLLVAGSAYGAHALYTFVRETPHLHVSHIEIMGTERANSEEVELLAIDALGVHTLDVDTREIARSVVRHPWVAWAEVRRVLPGGISVEVQERVPVALLIAGPLYYVDSTGYPFKKVSPGEPMDLPVLTGFEDPSSSLRSDGALGRSAVMAGLGVLGALEGAGYARDLVSEVHLDPDRGYSFFLTDGGAEVRLGWEAFEVKLTRLGKLQDGHGLELTRVARVDLDLDRAAVVTSLATFEP